MAAVTGSEKFCDYFENNFRLPVVRTGIDSLWWLWVTFSFTKLCDVFSAQHHLPDIPSCTISGRNYLLRILLFLPPKSN